MTVHRCAISLRFNFLSTDFSRSKGVKGVPVRLYAKTNILHREGEKGIMQDNPELCYCVVQLFRDHSAERKLLNDVAHLKKKIERLNKQITDRESGLNFIGPSCSYNLMNSGQLNDPPQEAQVVDETAEK